MRLILDTGGPQLDYLGMELFSEVYWHYLLRLLFAAFLGGIIGIDREARGKPAGMRTNILMCLGACLLMILSTEVARTGGKMADPGRIAAQVVTGIGFLGAGTIIRSRASVTGITTAATLWFVAALGLVVGYGGYVLALVATLLMLITLTTLRRLEWRIGVGRQLYVVHLNVAKGDKNLSHLHQVLIRHGVSPDDVDIEYKEDRVKIKIEYVAHDKRHQRILQDFQGLPGVEIELLY